MPEELSSTIAWRRKLGFWDEARQARRQTRPNILHLKYLLLFWLKPFLIQIKLNILHLEYLLLFYQLKPFLIHTHIRHLFFNSNPFFFSKNVSFAFSSIFPISCIFQLFYGLNPHILYWCHLLYHMIHIHYHMNNEY